jgi:hypothetical protein
LQKEVSIEKEEVGLEILIVADKLNTMEKTMGNDPSEDICDKINGGSEGINIRITCWGWRKLD